MNLLTLKQIEFETNNKEKTIKEKIDIMADEIMTKQIDNFYSEFLDLLEQYEIKVKSDSEINFIIECNNKQYKKTFKGVDCE
jgi:hypothetical protein